MNAIETALTGITYGGAAVPIAHLKYAGKAKTYLVDYAYLDQDEFFADGEPQDGGTYSTVDIYSKDRDAMATLYPDIKSRLRAAGFSIISAGPELHEDDTGMNHWPINIYQEREA
jgi:hypothetical protein